MIVRAAAIVALLLMPLGSEAFASRHHRPTTRISCSEVRYYVAKYSAPVASQSHRVPKRAALKMESIPSIISSAPNQVAVRLAACAEARYTGQDT